jgi:putative ABC transport system substrate-binding protein
MIASSMAIISEKCIAKNVPVIGAEKGQVENGALATEGIDYYKLGYQTGLMAFEVLNGAKPSDMPIETLKDTTLTINADVAEKLNLAIPDDIMNRAEVIRDGASK